jgi:DNA-binding HxlR family transcriptional regulator
MGVCEDGLECPCPPVGLIDVVGKKWAMCVVALLGKNGNLRFGPIQECLRTVSPATLTSTLRALEHEGLIRREAVAGDGRARAEYALTTTGHALYRSLLPFTSWLRSA